MRRLSETYIETLKNGFLTHLLQKVRLDFDLDLEIRSNYLNIYYKGNSLLKLDEIRPGCYRPNIHPKFLNSLNIPDLVDEDTTRKFLDSIPVIKENILLHGKSSIETEYEQMMIRANNYEPRNNSEYFIIDRQINAGEAGRFDLTGIYWSRNQRRKGQTVPLCLMELKFALNQDIRHVHEQLERYYDSVASHVSEMAEEAEILLHQKLNLCLFNQPQNRLDAMKTLHISNDIHDVQFILVPIDFNPNSNLFDSEKLSQLPFATQIRIFKTGFAMWSQKVVKICSGR